MKEYLKNSVIASRDAGLVHAYVHYDQLDDVLKDILKGNVIDNGDFKYVILSIGLNATKSMEFNDEDEYMIFNMGFRGKQMDCFIPYGSVIQLHLVDKSIQTIFNCNIAKIASENIKETPKRGNETKTEQLPKSKYNGKPKLTIVK